MTSFFERRGYSAKTRDLETMKNLSQSDALSKCNSTDEKMSRIPLVLTYHPLNTRVQRILLDNFKVIADDPATSFIFPLPPMFGFRRDDNLRTSLVHTGEKQAAAFGEGVTLRQVFHGLEVTSFRAVPASLKK